MENSKLVQKGFVKDRTFEISYDRVVISEKSRLSYSQYSIPFENIGKNININRRYNKDFLQILIVCILASLIGTFSFIFDITNIYKSFIKL